MDVIHEDLNRVINKPYTDSIDSNDRPDKIVSQEFWIKHIKRNQSMIVDYFTGQFKSKLTCPDCGKISITFDPFMSMPLQLISHSQA